MCRGHTGDRFGLLLESKLCLTFKGTILLGAPMKTCLAFLTMFILSSCAHSTIQGKRSPSADADVLFQSHPLGIQLNTLGQKFAESFNDSGCAKDADAKEELKVYFKTISDIFTDTDGFNPAIRNPDLEGRIRASIQEIIRTNNYTPLSRKESAEPICKITASDITICSAGLRAFYDSSTPALGFFAIAFRRGELLGFSATGFKKVGRALDIPFEVELCKMAQPDDDFKQTFKCTAEGSFQYSMKNMTISASDNGQPLLYTNEGNQYFVERLDHYSFCAKTVPGSKQERPAPTK